MNVFTIFIHNICKSRFLKFCIVGGSGILVNMSLLWFFTEKLGAYYIISSMISIETSIITNFFFNDTWTWKSVTSNGIRERLWRGLQFNLICALGAIINMIILYSLTEFLNIYYLISNIIGITVVVFWNFYVNDKVTWKH